MDDDAYVDRVSVWVDVSAGEGYGWDLRCGTPRNLVLGRIWKGEEALYKHTGLVSTVKILDIYKMEVECHIHVSLRRSGVEYGVMVSSRRAGWVHSSCEILVDFPSC